MSQTNDPGQANKRPVNLTLSEALVEPLRADTSHLPATRETLLANHVAGEVQAVRGRHQQADRRLRSRLERPARSRGLVCRRAFHALTGIAQLNRYRRRVVVPLVRLSAMEIKALKSFVINKPALHSREEVKAMSSALRSHVRSLTKR